MQVERLATIEQYIYDAGGQDKTKRDAATSFFLQFATQTPNEFVQLLSAFPLYSKNDRVCISFIILLSTILSISRFTSFYDQNQQFSLIQLRSRIISRPKSPSILQAISAESCAILRNNLSAIFVNESLSDAVHSACISCVAEAGAYFLKNGLSFLMSASPSHLIFLFFPPIRS